VEELFYLLWPLVLSKTKNYLKLFIAIIVITLAIRFLFAFLSYEEPMRILQMIDRRVRDYRFSCMAIGAIAAYIYMKDKRQILSFLYRKDLQCLVYVSIIFILFTRAYPPIIHPEFNSIFFAIIVLNLATNPNSVIRLDYPWMRYLGRISYGVYLFHPILRNLSLELVEDMYHKEISGWQMNLLLYVFTVGGTIIIASLSYRFFEKPFLSLKKHFV